MPLALKRKARQRQEASLFKFGLEPNSLELRDTHLLVLNASQIWEATDLSHVVTPHVSNYLDYNDLKGVEGDL